MQSSSVPTVPVAAIDRRLVSAQAQQRFAVTENGDFLAELEPGITLTSAEDARGRSFAQQVAAPTDPSIVSAERVAQLRAAAGISDHPTSFQRAELSGVIRDWRAAGGGTGPQARRSVAGEARLLHVADHLVRGQRDSIAGEAAAWIFAAGDHQGVSDAQVTAWYESVVHTFPPVYAEQNWATVMRSRNVPASVAYLRAAYAELPHTPSFDSESLPAPLVLALRQPVGESVQQAAAAGARDGARLASFDRQLHADAHTPGTTLGDAGTVTTDLVLDGDFAGANARVVARQFDRVASAFHHRQGDLDDVDSSACNPTIAGWGIASTDPDAEAAQYVSEMLQDPRPAGTFPNEEIDLMQNQQAAHGGQMSEYDGQCEGYS
jgi:hypothetical protein